MSQAGAPWQGPAANDINTREHTSRNTEPHDLLAEIVPEPETVAGLTHVSSILPSVVSDLLDHMADPSNYEVCEVCHRPSWTFARWMAEEARKDERQKIEWEEFAAGEELSRRELLTRLEHTRAMLTPRPVEGRKHLRVLP